MTTTFKDEIAKLANELKTMFPYGVLPGRRKTLMAFADQEQTDLAVYLRTRLAKPKTRNRELLTDAYTMIGMKVVSK